MLSADGGAMREPSMPDPQQRIPDAIEATDTATDDGRCPTAKRGAASRTYPGRAVPYGQPPERGAVLAAHREHRIRPPCRRRTREQAKTGMPANRFAPWARRGLHGYLVRQQPDQPQCRRCHRVAHRHRVGC
jgi:hypothetical protein